MAAQILDDAASLAESRGWPRLLAAGFAERIAILLPQAQLDEANLCMMRLERLANNTSGGDYLVHAEIRRCAVLARAQSSR